MSAYVINFRGALLYFYDSEIQALHIYPRKEEKELKKETMENLRRILEESLDFIFISDLEKKDVDFEKFFGSFHEVDFGDDFVEMVSSMAKSRGITEPCVCEFKINGERFLVQKGFSTFFLNVKSVVYDEDFYDEPWSDKGTTKFGWDHVSGCSIIKKEMKILPEYDYCLISRKIISSGVRCDDGEYSEFDKKECKGCDFYHECSHPQNAVQTQYLYVIKC